MSQQILCNRINSLFTKVALEKVSSTVDYWTADNTKAAYLGMTAHWINVESQNVRKIWTLHLEVIVCHWLSDNHSGENLGWYMVGLCDHIGIIGGKKSKVYLNSVIDRQLGSLSI